MPAKQQLPTTEPVPFQVSQDSSLRNCNGWEFGIILLICLFQLEGSKRLQQRAAAWQEEVDRFLRSNYFVVTCSSDPQSHVALNQEARDGTPSETVQSQGSSGAAGGAFCPSASPEVWN